MRNAYEVLAQKDEGSRLPRWPVFREENIKLDHVQTAWKGVEWIPLYMDHWWGFCELGEWWDTASPPNIITQSIIYPLNSTISIMLTFSLEFVKWSCTTLEFLFPYLFCDHFLSIYLYLTAAFFKRTWYILSNTWWSWTVSTLTVLKEAVKFDDNILFTWTAWQKLQWTSVSTATYLVNVSARYSFIHSVFNFTCTSSIIC